MASSKKTQRGQAYGKVLGFAAAHWRRQPRRVALIMGLFFIETVADILTPFFAGRLVEAVASGAATNEIAWNGAMTAFLVIVALGAASVLVRQLAFQTIIALTLRMMSDIAQNAFHRVQRFSSDWHANSFAGSTVRKITRGMWALDSLNDVIMMALLPSLVMLVGTTVMLSLFWPVMGLVIGVGSLIYITVTVSLSTLWVAPAASLANAWDTRMGGALADAVSCNIVVKGFGAEDREEARLGHVVDKWRRRTSRTWNRGTLNGTIQNTMLWVLRCAIIGSGLLLWQSGAATAGDVTFVITTFLVLQGYLRDIGQHVRNLQRAVNDMEELVALDDQKLGIEDKPGAKPMLVKAGAIDFEHVDFHYGVHLKPLYRQLDVHIAPGEKVGLVGHSGSGKTTFVKLIQRLHDVSGGRIVIDGIDIRDVQQASLRQQIAIVQQEPVLFHRSLAENIAYGRPGATRAQIEEAAKLANAHDFIAKLPKGYETLVGERGIKLSGGERQRVAIARAFLSDAHVLILDEATSSLDSESELLIQQAMERLMVGRTTIVIAHRLSTVRALDRLLVFDGGKVVEEGTHEQLVKRDGGIYRRLFERQALELIKGLEAAE
ncbi:multidrug ABC transporter ATP-binding protein [Devosia sp. Root413D1]|uniref:ABC transporter ATP-binding protein n=1 Tax=Devosia sp. Root413D1 TaxID=1736531 RepID=UPI0006FBA390|nr:ABC transporter ATP-binding protein [Devosia sp. Root413D1]KQW85652.1 multidrug ABC transporter ATP-binding protein [Devosia sp. Root413D1]